MRSTALVIATLFLSLNPAIAEEVIVRSLTLPFSSMEQEVTYHPSRREYEVVRNKILARLKQGDPTARANPQSGPWLRAVTTAKIGFEFHSIGASQGRVNYRQVSAAEEALYLFESGR
jgi:hypothetical protein